MASLNSARFASPVLDPVSRDRIGSPVAGAILGLWLCLAGIAAIGVSNVLITRAVNSAAISDAERTAQRWARFLANISSDPNGFLAKLRESPHEFEIVREAMRAKKIFLFKYFDPAGKLVFRSDIASGPESIEDLSTHNSAAASVALTGGTYAKSVTGGGKTEPAHYSEAYAPVMKGGTLVGVTEVYLDQSMRSVGHAQIAMSLSLAISLIVVASIALPAVFLVRRSRQMAEVERERQTQTARLSAAVESTPHGFVMFDRHNTLLVCNGRFLGMYGIPEHLGACGTRLEDLLIYMVTSGLLTDPQEVMRIGRDTRCAPDGVTERILRLADGRIIALASSPMADGGRVTIHTDITDKHKIAAQIAESEARFRDYAVAAADWCWETDGEHRCVFLTDGYQAATGLDPAAMLGKSRWTAPFHPDDAAAISVLEETLEKRLPFRDFCVRLLTASGTYATIKSNGAPRFDKAGHFLGYRGTARDVTMEEARKADLKTAEEALRYRTQLLEEAQRLGKIGNWHFALGSARQEWSAQIYSILRVSPSEGGIEANYILEKCLGDGAARIRTSLMLAARTREPQMVDVKVRCDDGTIIDCAVTSSAAYDEAGNLIGFRGTAQDISDRKRAEEQLERLAFHDPLTGLPNRAMFTRQLDALVAQEGDSGAALLLVDLDRFKDVNDSLGHASGDQLLAKVSCMIAARLQEHHLLARIGGDEFAVIVRHSSGPEAVASLAARIVDAVSGSVVLAHGEATIGASVGIAFVNGDIAAATLLRNADLALYKAKEGGRGRFEVFREELNGALQHKLRLERDLRRAVSENVGLSVEYQPLVDLAEGTVTGFEALLRWRHPELGMISPAEFIPIAEGSRLIIDIGRWVLREAAGQMMAWIDAGYPEREISVNVSAAQLWHSDLVGDVARILAETRLPPHLLCLELTESLLADPSEQRVRSGIGRLKELGIQLALDDFGTDYSWLGYLTQLPFDKLKIDRVFVDGVASSERRRALLKGIVALGHGLGMTVVGEGAECFEEIDVLRVLGCDVAQGYVLSRPMPPAQALVNAETFRLPQRQNGVHALQASLLERAG